MTQEQRKQPSWALVALLIALAGALGFGVAHWQGKRQVPEAAPVAAGAGAAGTAAASEGAPAEVKIPAEYLASAMISVEAVGNGGLGGEILVSGTVAAQANSEAVVVARAAGNVTRVLRQLGDTVKAGDVLAQVDSADAASLSAERAVTRAKAALARKVYVREAALFAQGVTARQEMEAAQSALTVADSEAQRATLVATAAQVAADGKSVAVVSPIAGRITSHTVTLGAYVQPHTELFHVAGNGPVQVEAALPAADLSRVAAGDKATIIAANGATVDATVRAVTPTVSGDTRSAVVVLAPVSTLRTLVVGEGVQARLHVRNSATGMVVPEDAVQNVDGRDVLFVRTGDGFVAQPVLVGARSGGAAHIVSGVRPGTQVATRNAFLIKADMIKSAKEE
jgi:cobalt-zinc-cadmium efflux system membrane fusion protein